MQVVRWLLRRIFSLLLGWDVADGWDLGDRDCW